MDGVRVIVTDGDSVFEAVRLLDGVTLALCDAVSDGDAPIERDAV